MFNTKKYIKDAFYASYMKKGLISKVEKINQFFKRLEVTKKQLIEIQKYAKKKKFYFFVHRLMLLMVICSTEWGFLIQNSIF